MERGNEERREDMGYAGWGVMEYICDFSVSCMVPHNVGRSSYDGAVW